MTIWSRTSIPSSHLLPVGSTLFGSFKLIDKHIAPSPSPSFSTSTTTSGSDSTTSYVDFGFSSDSSRFAGCHRFQITRQHLAQPPASHPATTTTTPTPPPPPTPPPTTTTIRLQHFRCNPQQNTLSAAEWIKRFHQAYAKVLFADGVRAIFAGVPPPPLSSPLPSPLPSPLSPAPPSAPLPAPRS